MKPEKKYLDQEQVTTYATLSAQIDALEKRRKKLRGKLIEKFEQGFACPMSGPYLLELYYQERHPVAWKEEWKELAKKTYGPNWRKIMKRIIAEVDTVRIPCIKPKTNPKYGAEEEGRVVAFRKRGAA